MTQDKPVTKKLLQVVDLKPECEFDELIAACPEYTWNQIFLAVDELSRTGRISLREKRRGAYVVTASRLLVVVT